VMERPRWRDAEEAARWLQSREDERGILLFLARLPLASEQVLEQLTAGSRMTVYRLLARLRHDGLVAAIKLPLHAGRSPELFYLTDLGLATIALDRHIELDQLVVRLHLRANNLVALLPRLVQLVATYDLLGTLAASRPGRPCLLAWERPWRRRYRRPTAKAPVSVTLPAYAALSWDNGHGAYLLLPDQGSFPLRLYRPVLGHMVGLRHGQYRTFPLLLVTTTGWRRAEAWEALLGEVGRSRRDVPLHARITIWGELDAGFTGLEALDQALSPDQLIQWIPWRPLSPPATHRPLPRPVGNTLILPRRGTSAHDLGARVLQLTPSDHALLDLLGHHPFLDREQLAVVLGWEAERVRSRRNRLIRQGWIWLVGTDETGDGAPELAELTGDGLELVATRRGLSLAVAIRELGLAGGGPDHPLGARRKLLQHLAHTRGVDALFVRLYGMARQLAARGSDDAVVEWQNAAACSRSHLRPDGYGLYRRRGWLHGFFLEFDRGTLNARDYAKKFAAYYAYGLNRRFERDYPGYPTILVVAADNTTERRVARAAQVAAVGQPQPLPLLLTCRWHIDDPSNQQGLLGRIWRPPDADFDDRRRWLSASGPDPHGPDAASGQRESIWIGVGGHHG